MLRQGQVDFWNCFMRFYSDFECIKRIDWKFWSILEEMGNAKAGEIGGFLIFHILCFINRAKK